jgi:uncharacterized protein (TIGR02145 family)
MKKLYTLLVFAITLTISAQAPQGFNYQATVRNNAGALIINKSVSFKFNIIPTSANGTATYSETQTVTTDDLGQVSLVIGKGTATTGTFATIDWGTGTYYLGIELNTGNGFVAMGATQLLSVPYALYAKSSGEAAIPTLASVLAKNNSANATKITNLADPTDAQDAATKAYVDANSKSFMDINGFENSQTWQDNSTVNLVPNSFNFINANNTTLVFPSKPDNCCSRDVIYIYMMQNPDKQRKVTLKPNGFPVAFSKYEDNELKSSISNTIQFVGVFKSGLNTIINVGDFWMCADFFYNETITIPTLTTNPVSLISYTSANSGGTISNDGGSPVTSRGIVWSTTKNPTIALTTKTINSNGNGAFSSTLSGLTNGTTYYIRAYATNSVGTSYGNEITFTTAGLITVTIGNQIWTSKNIDITTYRDGTPIPQVTDPTAWANLTTGAWCYYNNDSSNDATYGKLYNWFAVAGIWNEASKTDVNQRKKLAPTGYHVPSDSEWSILTTYLGGEGLAGGKMKEAGTTHWQTPNQDATNSSGFTGLPGGYCINGTFGFIGFGGYWWSSTDDSAASAWRRDLKYNNSLAERTGGGNTTGFSVRLIKD